MSFSLHQIMKIIADISFIHKVTSNQCYIYLAPEMKSIGSSELSSDQHDLLNVIHHQAASNTNISHIMTHLVG